MQSLLLPKSSHSETTEGLEFQDKGRLAEFFQKTRELFPDSCLQIDSILRGVDHVVGEWTLRTTVTEPFYAGQSRKVQILPHGVSVVQTNSGRLRTGRTTMMVRGRGAQLWSCISPIGIGLERSHGANRRRWNMD